jgi:hypothetical protein
MGAKGARVKFGPKGTYVDLSAHCISYRRIISSPHRFRDVPTPEQMPVYTNEVRHVSSGAIEQLTDTDSKVLSPNLNRRLG